VREDLAHVSGDRGIAIWAVQHDTLGSMGADGDYAPLQVNASGAVYVQIDAAGLTALQLIDDIVYVDDADWTDSSSKHALVGGLYQETPQTVTTGDVAPFQIDSHGNIVEANSGAIKTAVQLIDDTVATVDAAITAKGLALAGTDGTNARIVKTDSSGELQVDVLSITAGDNNIGNVDIVTQPSDTFAADGQAYGKGVLIQGDDGTDRTAVLVGTDGHLQVDVLSAASTAVTNAGTFVTQENGALLTAMQGAEDELDGTTTGGPLAKLAGAGLTFSQVVIDQDAAGRLDLGGNVESKYPRLHALVVGLTIAGTITIHHDSDGAGGGTPVQMTGEMPVGANGGVVIPFCPHLDGALTGSATNRHLTLTSTGGAANGYAIISTSTSA
ncbi:MAG TPA: hypothetical protein VMY35_00490, partial [Phycisphaerae bacterium]|nr:hypothetical protein [Phycisphaerae bacterium]